MSTEAVLPDYAFNLQQKEYLQGLFAGLASGGLRTFVGHLPDGRITNIPAPGLENRAEPEPSDEKTVYGTPVSDLCEQEIWKLEQLLGTSLSPTPSRTSFQIKPTRSGFAIMASFM